MEDYRIITTETLKYVKDRLWEIQRDIDKEIKSSLEMKGMLDNYEVCKILGITLRTLQHYRDANKVPFVMIQGKCLYKEDDLQKLIEKNKTESIKKK